MARFFCLLVIHRPDEEPKASPIEYLERWNLHNKLFGDGNTANFDSDRRIVVSDTHRANMVLMPDGNLAPIDLRVQVLARSLLDTV
jgi:hypothetical protein